MAKQPSAASPQPENNPDFAALTPAQRLEVLQQKEKAIRKRLWQSALLALTAFIAICAVGIAWFVNNSRVTGSGVQVQTSGPAFELATAGSEVGVVASPQPTGAPAEINSKAYYSTSGSNTLVAWMVDATSNLNNADGKTLRPGSSGKITFYVLPQQENLGVMDFSIDLIPYGQAASGPAENTIQIEGSDFAPLSDTTGTRAQELLAGHLLFFAGWDETTRTYSNRLIPGETFASTAWGSTQGNITGTAPVAFTVYWVWPELFRYYIDTSGTGRLFTDSSDMINYINAHPGSFYNTGSNLVPSDPPSVSTDITTEALTICSGYYNNADQYLGSNIRYLQFQLNADRAAAPATP